MTFTEFSFRIDTNTSSVSVETLRSCSERASMR